MARLYRQGGVRIRRAAVWCDAQQAASRTLARNASRLSACFSRGSQGPGTAGKQEL